MKPLVVELDSAHQIPASKQQPEQLKGDGGDSVPIYLQIPHR
jgi:hypothetical protein